MIAKKCDIGTDYPFAFDVVLVYLRLIVFLRGEGSHQTENGGKLARKPEIGVC